MPEAYDEAQNPDMALEVLRHAQEVVRFKIQSADAITAKMTTLFGQAILLSLAAFSGAAVGEAKNSWMPPWAAVGLVIAGLGWGGTAAAALAGAIIWRP